LYAFVALHILCICGYPSDQHGDCSNSCWSGIPKTSKQFVNRDTNQSVQPPRM